MHWLARLTAAGAAFSLLATPPSPAAGEATPTPPPASTGQHHITLITGDTVTVRDAEAGKQAVTVEPAKGRERITFTTRQVDGKLQVVPDDMVPYLADDLVDADLFAVNDLIAQGYDDASSKTLPLLVSYDAGARTAGALPGLRSTGTPLASVNAQAVGAAKGELAAFWKAVEEAPSARSNKVRLASGIKKIWLDGKVTANLERSVPQVGAPEAWQSGFDGKGVKVAVLDTGIDENHPDVAGKVTERRNFTSDPSAHDGHGHGTHVAATVAGLGTASGSSRKGVAPGAELIVGKVLSDAGQGQDSQVIQGMEWAAASGASVVNMSLGGGATDGTDPISVALDTLTEQTGTLFVVAAGNEGQDYSVGSPGAATSALTVGAVDSAEALAPFSSRGPRLDGAAKPDITAPGVGIVAARSEGTVMGQPVDERYTAASGTSMATPHVAGAAAILKQRHPDWKAQQIKDVLVSTARTADGLSVYEQGGGRLDVARAVRQEVTATGVLDLGTHEEGGTSNPAGTITYTNSTKAPVTLAVTATFRNLDGEAPTEGALTPGPTSVTVDAGTTATLPVTVDPAKISRGRHSGHVTAATADGSVAVHTTLAVTKAARTHTVHVSGIGKDGKPSDIANVLLFGQSWTEDVLGYILPYEAESGKTYEVAEGTYFAQGHFSERAGRHPIDILVDIPEFQVNGDVELVFDARKTRPIVIKVPKPVVQEGFSTFATWRETASRKISVEHMNYPSIEELHVAPTQPVRQGAFEFASRWQYAAPKLSSRLAGSREPLDLSLMVRSPELNGRHVWPLVDGGSGTREELGRLKLRNRAVVLSTAGHEDPGWDEKVTAAAAAGAKAVVIIPSSQTSPWQPWSPTIEKYPLTAVTIPYDQGVKVLERIHKGSVVLDVTGTMVSPYLYDVSQVSPGQVPEQIVHEVGPGNLARVDAGYHETGGFGWGKEQRFAWRPWQTFSMEGQRWVRTGSERAEYVSSGDTRWQHVAQHMYTWLEWSGLTPGLVDRPRTYAAGQTFKERWFGPVVRPAIPSDAPELAPIRTGDTLKINIPEFVDAAGHHGYAHTSDEADTVSARFSRDGEPVQESGRAVGDFPAVPEKATYRMELSTKRSSEEWTYSTSTDTAWTFTSARPASGTEPLPLLGVDYTVPTDLNGRVRRALPIPLDLTVRSTAPGLAVRQVTAELSYDDGKSWKRLVLLPRGGNRYSTLVSHKAEKDRYMSLRVTAEDNAGNAVEQTVLRAYGVK